MTEVTDKMIAAGYEAHKRWVCEVSGFNTVESMRAAIEAALAAREPVAAIALSNELRLHSGHRERLQAAAVIEELVEALKKLANETRGLLSAFEQDFRSMAGNTNYNCLAQREEEARTVLTRMGVKLT